ncbi:MAG: hypothetical protein IKE66_01110 [Hyphomicrobium sp.]|nr:hypothetical protein [Hyphomicrobium sp.]
MIVRILIERVGSGQRGEFWKAMHDGIVIVKSSRTPEHDAARELKAMGICGTMETRHAGSAIVSMRMNIDTAADRSVIESERTGPKFARFQPFTLTQRAA